MARTNIEIDDGLLTQAFRLTRIKTKKAVVRRALEELVIREKRKVILRLEGKINWRGSLTQMRKGRAWS